MMKCLSCRDALKKKEAMEWQQQGETEWVFGEKIRGIVRFYYAEIYYDEDSISTEGGWIWMVHNLKTFTWPYGVTRDGMELVKRGCAGTLPGAVSECEEVLKEIGILT